MSNNQNRYKLIRVKTTESIVKNRNSWTFTIAVLCITLTICFLLVAGKVDIDSSTLLSLILAFFSIYLSAQFYFKATEQSNQFYDRSYNHTRDMAKTLSAMEGKFGEGLRNIETHSLKLNERLEKIPLEAIREKNNQIDDTEKEKEQIIQELLDKSNVDENERKVYRQRLGEIESQNYELKLQLEKLISKNDNNVANRYRSKDINNLMRDPQFNPGVLHEFINDIGPANIRVFDDARIQEVFKVYVDSHYPEGIKTALRLLNYIDNENNVTEQGIQNLKSLAEDFISQ